MERRKMLVIVFLSSVKSNKVAVKLHSWQILRHRNRYIVKYKRGVVKTSVGLIHVAAVGKPAGLFSCVIFKFIDFLDFLHRKGKSKVHPRTGHESPNEE